jgi:gas vesicle protein
VIGLLCGAALGAAVGLMFAPKAGSELRQTLYDSTGDIRKKASDAYGQATQTVNEYVSKGRDAVERGKQAFDSARQSAGASGTESFSSGRSDFSGTSSGVQS